MNEGKNNKLILKFYFWFFFHEKQFRSEKVKGERCIYKIFQCERVQIFMFPSYDLFFQLKRRDFCFKKKREFSQSVRMRTPATTYECHIPEDNFIEINIIPHC